MNINITGGGIRLTVNDDPHRVIAFDPEDVAFVEGFYGLVNDLEAKQKEVEAQAAELEKGAEADSMGIPKNTGAQIALLREVCGYLKARIDTIFGEGTSQAAFGGANSLVMFQQFFEGISPFIQAARSDRISKYTKTGPGGVMK